MKAVGNYIVIKSEEENTKTTKGGLILDQANREDIRYKQARVVDTGILVDMVQNDDIVYYDKFAGDKIEVDGEVFEVIKDSDVIIIL